MRDNVVTYPEIPGNSPENKKRSHDHGAHQHPRPQRGPQHRRHRDEPGSRARWPAAGDSPAAAVLAALSAEPAGATVAVIAGHAGISTAAARQALLAHEKNGTATRIKGSRPGIADTWTPAAAPAAPGDEAPPAETPAASSTADAGQHRRRRAAHRRAGRQHGRRWPARPSPR